MNMRYIQLRFLQFWQQRSARERASLALATTLLILAVLYLLWINPLLRARAQLRQTLPSLRVQATQFANLREQAAHLQNSGSPTTPLTQAQLIDLLTRKGLKPQSIFNQANLVELQWPSVSFARLIDGLHELQRQFQVTIVAADIVSLAALDQTQATVTVRLYANDARQ